MRKCNFSRPLQLSKIDVWRLDLEICPSERGAEKIAFSQ
jgi:hypothetical protein